MCKNLCTSKLGKVCRLFDTLRIHNAPLTDDDTSPEEQAEAQKFGTGTRNKDKIRKEEVGVPEPCRPNPGLLLHPSEGAEPTLSQPCAARVVPLFLSAWLVSLARDHAWRAWLFLVLEFEPPTVQREGPGRDP